jgi:hypothetical protein
VREPSFCTQKKKKKKKACVSELRADDQDSSTYLSRKRGVSVGAVGVVAFLEQPVDAEGTILHPFEMSELASISLQGVKASKVSARSREGGSTNVNKESANLATIAVEEEVAVLCILILHFGNLMREKRLEAHRENEGNEAEERGWGN